MDGIKHVLSWHLDSVYRDPAHAGRGSPFHSQASSNVPTCQVSAWIAFKPCVVCPSPPMNIKRLIRNRRLALIVRMNSCALLHLSGRLAAMVLAATGFFVGSFASADEVVTLNTRAGVTQSILIWQPHRPNPRSVILLIPGGLGNIGLNSKNAPAEAEDPYLFSNRREALLQGGFAVAVIDAPSDQEDLTQEFRTSPQHLTDLQAVMNEIQRRFPDARLVVMAHSRGTVSASQILQKLGARVSAAVFFSGLYRASAPAASVPSAGPGLSRLDWASLNVPVLLVHHTQDSCPVAPFAAAVSTKVPLIAVNGAADRSDASGCGNPASNHWLAGMESAVAQEVTNWLNGKTWRRALP